MNSPLDRRQMSRARTLVLVLFFAHLAGLLTLVLFFANLAGLLTYLQILIELAVMASIILACWWLARLPLGRRYRGFMAASALTPAAATVADALSLPDIGPWRDGPDFIAYASDFFSLVAPLLLCQAMVLFSAHTGLARAERSWRRARLGLFLASGSWIALVTLERFGLSQSAIGEDLLGGHLLLFVLGGAAVVVFFLFFFLALFVTQREIGLATRRAAEHPKLA